MSINNLSAVSDAVKYLNGIETTETSLASDVKGSVFSPVTGVFVGFGAKSALADKYKAVHGADSKASIKNIFEWIKGNKATGEAGVGVHLGIENAAEVKKEARTFKGFKENFTKEFFKEETKAAEKTAAKAGKGTISKITTPIKKGLKTVGTKIKSLPVVSKAGELLKKIPGASKAGKLFKGSGAGFMVAIDGGMELFQNVIPAFKNGGAASGFKQIGKSALKVAGSTVGWVVGAKAGTAAGTAIGTAICPGIGTAIGAAVGFIGGMIGSAICGKAAEKIAGKSETEKLQEQQTQAAAQQIAQDSASMQDLNAMVTQKVQEDIASGNVTKDTEKMIEYLNSGSLGTSVSSADSYTTTTPTATTATQPTSTNWVNDTVNRINQGDTSVYNISDERLNNIFVKKENNSFNTSNSTSSADTLNAQDDKVNYFA